MGALGFSGALLEQWELSCCLACWCFIKAVSLPSGWSLAHGQRDKLPNQSLHKKKPNYRPGQVFTRWVPHTHTTSYHWGNAYACTLGHLLRHIFVASMWGIQVGHVPLSYELYLHVWTPWLCSGAVVAMLKPYECWRWIYLRVNYLGYIGPTCTYVEQRWALRQVTMYCSCGVTQSYRGWDMYSSPPTICHNGQPI